MSEIYIRFDGPPEHEAGRFVEVERDGKGIKIGEWRQDGEYWLLVLTEHMKLEANNAKLLIAIDLIITHLTSYDLDDEMDAGDFAELHPEAWSIFQEVVAENKDLTTPSK